MRATAEPPPLRFLAFVACCTVLPGPSDGVVSQRSAEDTGELGREEIDQRIRRFGRREDHLPWLRRKDKRMFSLRHDDGHERWLYSQIHVDKDPKINTHGGCYTWEAMHDRFDGVGKALAGHPNISGWCYFSRAGDWARLCQEANENQDYSRYGLGLRGKYIADLAAGGEDHLVLSVNCPWGSLRTNNDVYLYDDYYCAALGYMDLPWRKAYNWTEWDQLAKKECDKLTKIHPDYMDFNMYGPNKLEKWEDDEQRLWEHAYFHEECPAQKLAQRHAAYKCALGGIGCDMAFCAMNFCRDETGKVRHGNQCSPDKPQSKPSRRKKRIVGP